jgi:hypothetical protein
MTAQPLPSTPEAQLAAWKQDVEERLRVLETAPRATNTSVRNGVWTILDDEGHDLLRLSRFGLDLIDLNGNLRLRIGQITNTPGDLGIIIADEVGRRFWIDSQGTKDPWYTYPWRNPNAAIEVVETDWTPVWVSHVPLLQHKGVQAYFNWATDADVEAEVRLRVLSPTDSSGNDPMTDTVELPMGENNIGVFRWLHGVPVGTMAVEFALDARVTAGTGSLWMYESQAGLTTVDPQTCTATGLPA